MEHQSAVAYGNHYMNGYLGRDLSGTGHGLKWDFIIVHESAHEWFGNNITVTTQPTCGSTKASRTTRRGFTPNARRGKKAGAEYVIGTRRLPSRMTFRSSAPTA